MKYEVIAPSLIWSLALFGAAMSLVACAAHDPTRSPTPNQPAASPHIATESTQSEPTLRIELEPSIERDQGITWLRLVLVGPEPLAREAGEVLYMCLSGDGVSTSRFLEARGAENEPVPLVGAHPPHRVEKEGSLITQHRPIAQARVGTSSTGRRAIVQPIMLRTTPGASIQRMRLRPELLELQPSLRTLVGEPRLLLEIDHCWREAR